MIGNVIGIPFARRRRGVSQETIDRLMYYFADHADEPLLTPAEEDIHNTNIHAYVIDFLSEHGIAQWNGYRFWQGFTPMKYDETYPAQWENPNIIASNDGINWEVPAGFTNPLYPRPGPLAKYNSDPFLFYENGTLYYFFRNANARILVRSTTDGVNWTDAVQVWDLNDPPGNGFASMQIVKIGGDYWMYGHGKLDDPNTPWIFRLKASSVTGPYTYSLDEYYAIDISNCNNQVRILAGDDIMWHKSIRKVNENLYFITLVFNQGGLYSSTWSAWSNDGKNFKMGKFPIMSVNRQKDQNSLPHKFWDHYFYIPDTTYYYDNNELKFNLWYVGQARNAADQTVSKLGQSVLQNNNIGIDFASTFEGQNTISTQREVELIEANALTGDWFFADDFNRANSDAILQSSSGKSWSMFTNAVVGIRDNYAVNLRGGEPATGLSFFKTADKVPLNYEATIQMIWAADRSTTGNTTYIIFRYPQAWIQPHAANIRTYIGLGNELDGRIMNNWFKHDTLNEIKIRYFGSTHTIELYINGCQLYRRTITLADFASESAFNTYKAADDFGFRFFSDSQDKIKNVTIKDLGN